MTAPADLLKLRLLHALVAGPQDQASQLADLAAADWLQIDHHAAQHRLRPLLHGLQSTAAPAWPVPPAIAQDWRAAHQRSARRYLRHLSAMAEIAQCLEAAGLPYAFLKGSALTTGLYPDPALRPLRDLDILVLPDQAEQAAELLRTNLGYTYPAPRAGLIPEDYAHHKHLRPLLCLRRKVTVELHRRLADKPVRGGAPQDDVLFDPVRLLHATRSVQMGSASIRLLDWPETLLHLVTHAVHDHQLNVGPLILCDVQIVLSRTELDMSRFWALADEAGRASAAELIFAVLSRFGCAEAHAALVKRSAPALLASVVEAAAVLLLQDTSKGLAVGSWTRILSGVTLAGAIPLAVRRWRHLRQTAARTGSGQDDVRLSLWQRGRAMAGGLVDAADRREIRRNKTVIDWLNRAQ